MSVPPYQQPNPPVNTFPQPQGGGGGGYNAPTPPKKSALPWILGIGCGIPIVLLVGCIALGGQIAQKVASDPKFKQEMKKLNTNTAKDKVAYDPATFKMTPTETGAVVSGTIKNKSGETLPYLLVRFDVLNERGEKVGTAVANTTKVAPGATWEFEAQSVSDKPTKFKLIGITNAPLDMLQDK